MSIDWDFIKQLEGFTDYGIVPSRSDGAPIGQSGVTIGSGVDLGQWSREQLEDMGVSPSILEKLEPYFGKRKEQAQSALNEQPLNLTEAEANELTEAAGDHFSREVRRWFNRNSSMEWKDLTDRQKTVITSVSYQYGAGLDNAPNFARQVLEGDWDAAVENLRNFGDEFQTRRHQELQYLVGADVDGVVGPQTEQAIEQFKQAPFTQAPQEATQRETELPTQPGRDRQESSQGVSQRLSEAVSEGVRLGEEQQVEEEPEDEALSPMEQGFTEAEVEFIQELQDQQLRSEREQQLQRQAREAELARKAKESKEESRGRRKQQKSPEEKKRIDQEPSDFTEEEWQFINELKQTSMDVPKGEEDIDPSEASVRARMEIW